MKIQSIEAEAFLLFSFGITFAYSDKFLLQTILVIATAVECKKTNATLAGKRRKKTFFVQLGGLHNSWLLPPLSSPLSALPSWLLIIRGREEEAYARSCERK